MSNTFNLTIDLGNDAMRTEANVAEAITNVREQLLKGVHGAKVFDLNGNTVGSFEYDYDGVAPGFESMCLRRATEAQEEQMWR